MKITNCLMNHLENPLGFAMDAPVFSYQVEDAAGKHQAAARIRISADAQGQQVLADTGFAPLNSLGERIALPLRPCTRYWWTAAVRTDAGEEAASEPHWFETGKREQAWQGQWIPVHRKKNGIRFSTRRSRRMAKFVRRGCIFADWGCMKRLSMVRQ